MSSINAGSIVALAVAVALLELGAVGSAAAQPVAAPVASPECLTNRYEPVVSETDARHLGRLERGEARRTRAAGAHVLPHKSGSSSPAARVLARNACCLGSGIGMIRWKSAGPSPARSVEERRCTE